MNYNLITFTRNFVFSELRLNQDTIEADLDQTL